ncbi:GDYXXLXY domain-containing protein [Alphaproteobacteria bacterium]|nr:GDYXXLXY domain-containing protein [Alphaproteobacteria bacterium]
MTRNNRLTIALLLPILLLVALAVWKAWVVAAGNLVTLPIVGFDPRDLLSGHYLIYRIDYGVEGLCKEPHARTYVCMKPKTFFDHPPSSGQCRIFIKGECRNGQFKAGIERFYIPEGRARELDRVVRNKRGSVILALDGKGGAQIADLLIDGRTWKDFETKISSPNLR